MNTVLLLLLSIMAEIKHLLKINVPYKQVFDALTTDSGLSSWWTPDVKCGKKEGAISRFTFSGETTFMMKITNMSAQLVEWKCVEGPQTWINTDIHFQLDDEGDATILHFSHTGWRSKGVIFQTCSFDWCMFLSSLRTYLEEGEAQTGKGEIRLARGVI